MNERRVDCESGTVVVRPATAADVERLHALFEGLPLEDEYSRFFSAYRPDEQFLTRMATANESGACQLIAVVEHPDGSEETVGEAGAWPRPNGNGELAITVARGHRGWLGPYLLDALLQLARERGMANVEADVLITNSRMLALLRARGYTAVSHDGYSSVRLVVSTEERVPSWPASDHRPRVLVEASGARWAGETAAAAAGLQVLVCPGPKGRPRGTCPALEGQACPLAAEADAIVVHLPVDHRDALVDAHRELHGSVPVCVEVLPHVDTDATVKDLAEKLVTEP